MPVQAVGVTSAAAFGSAVMGKIRENSDVDFLIRFSPDLDIATYVDNYFKLLYSLQDLLHRDVDIVAEETVEQTVTSKNLMLQNIFCVSK